jgi:soluble lytic murein transglycosylase-like protein
MSVILKEDHERIVRKVKKRANGVCLVAGIMVVLVLVFPWVWKIQGDLIKSSYVVVRQHLVELKSRYVLLEILRTKPLSVGQALEVSDVVMEESKANSVPIHLILSLMDMESEFKPEATSSVGARGLMQVMPATWNLYVAEPSLRTLAARHNPALNVRVAIRYLGDLIKEHKDMKKVLKEYGGYVSKSPDGYVKAVMVKAEIYRRQLGEHGDIYLERVQR